MGAHSHRDSVILMLSSGLDTVSDLGRGAVAHCDGKRNGLELLLLLSAAVALSKIGRLWRVNEAGDQARAVLWAALYRSTDGGWIMVVPYPHEQLSNWMPLVVLLSTKLWQQLLCTFNRLKYVRDQTVCAAGAVYGVRMRGAA